MTWWLPLAVLGGGTIGALARYGATVLGRRLGARFPWAVLVVNVVGSFVAGAVSTAVAPHDPALGTVVITGFCGGLTTFSTWTVDTVGLARGGRWVVALWNVVGNLVLGVLAVALGTLV